MKVNEFSKKIGIPSSKIRYYDRMKLIQGERQDNNYRDFERNDVLDVYHAQMLRSFDMSIQETLQAKNDSLAEIDEWTSDYIQRLEESIRHQTMKLVRMKEMKRYFDAIQNEWDILSYYPREDSWNICHIGKEEEHSDELAGTIEKLASVMPFSYIAIKVKKESLLDEGENLDVRIGLGILERNRELLKIAIPSSVKVTPGGGIIQQYLEIEDPFSMTKKDIQPLLDKLNENGIVIEDDLVGRIYISYQKENIFVHGVVLAYPFEK